MKKSRGIPPLGKGASYGNTDFRIDDDRFPLVAGQGFCQDAGKHTFSAPWAAPDGNDFSHRKLLSQGRNALDCAVI